MILKDNRYHLSNGIDPLELVEKYGTPLYVYDTAIIERQYRLMEGSFAVPKLWTAASPNPAASRSARTFSRSAAFRGPTPFRNCSGVCRGSSAIPAILPNATARH